MKKRWMMKQMQVKSGVYHKTFLFYFLYLHFFTTQRTSITLDRPMHGHIKGDSRKVIILWMPGLMETEMQERRELKKEEQE